MTAKEQGRRFVVGNWKMHGLRADLAEAKAIAMEHGGLADRVDAGLCLPATLLGDAVGALRGLPLLLGGQDCHMEEQGAFTGDVSARMISDLGAALVIVGHSERRQYHGETDAQILAKARAARAAGLHPIICIGETEPERDAGQTLDRLAVQIEDGVPEDFAPNDFTIAYEPVWAIGTGRTPSTDEIAEAHAFIHERARTRLRADASPRVLYGGSAKPENAAELFSIDAVNGALVGGASLKAQSFIKIVRTAAQL
ncbi:MAG: triose-phosphate isomerase [Parvularculaceae bacterium]